MSSQYVAAAMRPKADLRENPTRMEVYVDLPCRDQVAARAFFRAMGLPGSVRIGCVRYRQGVLGALFEKLCMPDWVCASAHKLDQAFRRVVPVPADLWDERRAAIKDFTETLHLFCGMCLRKSRGGTAPSDDSDE